MIAVLAILGIVASISTAFIVHSVQSYRDVRHSLQMTQQGRQMIERITRELRNAVPGTVRVNQQNCIEFYPISASGRYLGRVAKDQAGEISQITLQFLSVSGQEKDALFGADGLRLSIGAAGANDFYGSDDEIHSDDVTFRPWVHVSKYQENTNVVEFGGHEFYQDSNANRVYFMHGNTSKLCVVEKGATSAGKCDKMVIDGDEDTLRELCITGYRLSPDRSNTYIPFTHLLSKSILSQKESYFSVNGSSLTRNAVVNMTLPLVDPSGEGLTPITFNHQIMVRNAQ